MSSKLSAALLSLALPFAAAPAAAQSTAAQAVKQARAEAKAVLAEHKQRTAVALDQLDAALAALVAGLAADQFGAPLLQTFLDSAHAFQLEVADATEEADLALADAFAGALEGLADAQGGPLVGEYPPGFVSGDGGAFDDAVDALARAVARLHAKVEARGGKAIAKARSVGVGLTLQFVPPRRLGFHGPTESGTVGTFHNPVRVHLIAGASRLDTAHDGLLLVAGTGSTVSGDVTVQLFSADPQGGFLVVQQDATPESFPGLGGEWSALIDDDGQFLVETNYTLDAFFAGDLTSADGCAGIP